MRTPDELREQLAALAHEQWTGWMQHLYSRCLVYRTISQDDWDRWARQMATPYANLSEAEKDSDRKEADRVLALLSVVATPNPQTAIREQVLAHVDEHIAHFEGKLRADGLPLAETEYSRGWCNAYHNVRTFILALCAETPQPLQGENR